MDINRAALEELLAQVNTSFQDGINTAPNAALMELATVVGSTGYKNIYAWLNQIPGFKEWVEGSGRKMEDVVSKTFEVVNIEYEASLRMPKNNLADAQGGDLGSIYAPMAMEMGNRWVQKKINAIINVLIDNPNCYDGGAIIADSHDTEMYGSSDLDNLVTTSLSAAAFQAAFSTAGGWKFGNGESTETNWTHLVVGPSLRTTAWNIVKNSKVASGSAEIDNPDQGRTELIVSPKLNAAAGAAGNVDAEHYWFMLDLSRPIKPVILQIREEAEVLVDIDPAIVKRTGFVDFLANGRLAAAPTFPHLIYGAQATS